MKNFLTVLTCLICSCLLVFGQSFVYGDYRSSGYGDLSAGIFAQTAVRRTVSAHPVPVLFYNGEKIGMIHSMTKLKKHLKDVYDRHYADAFPDSSLELGPAYVIREEPSFFVWEDQDERILNWLDERKAYGIAAVGISFSNDQGVYARICVRQLSLYENALRQYLSFFTDSSTLEKLLDGMNIEEPQNYGFADVGLSIDEKTSVYDTRAVPEQILTREDQVLDWLEYGNDTQKKYYTVQEGDTLEGIGEKNGGLTPEQLAAVNGNILESSSDRLKAGTKLCVTYFNSPLTVEVYRDRLRKEPVYAESQTVVDQSWPHGDTVIQNGQDGSENILVREKWINGIYEDYSIVSSLVTEEKKDRLVSSSDASARQKGSGMYRLPVDYASVSCSWACMAGGESVSYRNAYEAWGSVHAVDNGSLESSGSDDQNGNWIMLDHHNGLHSFYAHLQEPCTISEGTVIQKGEVIGNIGSTGNSTYPHLTFYFADDEGHHINPVSVSGYPRVSS